MEKNLPKLRISNRQRIQRILDKICSASLPVLLRTLDSGPTAVRGRASNLMRYRARDCFRVSNISAKGIEHIGNSEILQIEFVGRSTQLTFKTKVINVQGNSIIFDIPKVIESVERRQNARFVVTDSMTSFIEMGLWRASSHQTISPPVFDVYPNLASMIKLADISEGGVCAVSRFPGMLSTIGKGVIDDAAYLYLPMQTPVRVGVEIRWIKRIKENIDMEKDGKFARYYRFGANFLSLSDEASIGIQQYLKQLSMADAI